MNRTVRQLWRQIEQWCWEHHELLTWVVVVLALVPYFVIEETVGPSISARTMSMIFYSTFVVEVAGFRILDRWRSVRLGKRIRRLGRSGWIALVIVYVYGLLGIAAGWISNVLSICMLVVGFVAGLLWALRQRSKRAALEEDANRLDVAVGGGEDAESRGMG